MPYLSGHTEIVLDKSFLQAARREYTCKLCDDTVVIMKESLFMDS